MMCGFMGNGRAQHVTHLVCCNRALLPENLAFGMLALFINFTLFFFWRIKIVLLIVFCLYVFTLANILFFCVLAYSYGTLRGRQGMDFRQGTKSMRYG